MNQRMYLEKMKREGMLPPREFREREIDISSSAELREPYVPPEGDGIKSKFSKEGRCHLQFLWATGCVGSLYF
jgi:hypothetical protein